MQTLDNSQKPYAGYGNTNAQKHGGEAGIKSLTSGCPLVGLAHESEERVKAELKQIGAAGLLERSAVRLQSVADLFYSALEAATQADDIAALDRFATRYGWLQSSAARLWLELRKNDGKQPIDYEKLIESQNK